MLLAVPPAPGLTVANTVWFQTGSLGSRRSGGPRRVRARPRPRAEPRLGVLHLRDAGAGRRLHHGGDGPVRLRGPLGEPDRPGRRADRRSGDSFALSDIALIPVQLNWSAGAFSFKASQAIIAPTGAYDPDRAVNLGRNYWSFDTAAAVTWFDPEGGREVSLAPGIMFNTENPDTDYRTGAEFHLDFTATQFLSESFAVGLRGYWYKQITGDSGAGAVLGDFKSESVGLGLGFLWTPPVGDGRLSILGKWMHDVYADNRFESDYFTLTGAWTF
jgi:hypothetical protein